MRCSFVLSVLALCLSGALSQKINFGGCPKVQVKKDFDVSQYMGKWYEIEKIPAPFEYGLKCNTATYEDKGDYVSVVNQGVKVSSGEISSIEGEATIPDKNVPAKLKVDFNMPVKADYWVLDTDYDKYSLVYSCFDVLKIFKTEYLWILSRQKTMDDETKQKLYKILDDNKINRKLLKPTKQDCDN